MAPSLYRLRKTAAPLAWLLAGMLILLPVGRHAAGVVLCIESDGHISVENAVGIICSTPSVGSTSGPASPRVLLETSTAAAGHCVDCVDLPVPRGGDEDCASFKLERLPTSQIDLPLAAVPPRIEREASPAAHALPLSATPAGAVPDRTLLRSVVLLI